MALAALADEHPFETSFEAHRPQTTEPTHVATVVLVVVVVVVVPQ